LGNAGLHLDGWTAPRGESSFIQQLSRDTPFHLRSRLESRYRQGIEQEVKESREVEMERQRCQRKIYKRMIRHAMRDHKRTRGRPK
jgi:hypothetical protein